MKPRRFVAVLVAAAILASFGIVYGATRARAKPVPAAAKSAQWEYLVVTAEAAFSSNSEQPNGALNKRIGDATYPFVEQATFLQMGMDSLGKQGWELVAVLGTIGGDQEFIFKRRR